MTFDKRTASTDLKKAAYIAGFRGEWRWEPWRGEDGPGAIVHKWDRDGNQISDVIEDIDLLWVNELTWAEIRKRW